jgi:hypothetical protein
MVQIRNEWRQTAMYLVQWSLGNTGNRPKKIRFLGKKKKKKREENVPVLQNTRESSEVQSPGSFPIVFFFSNE